MKETGLFQDEAKNTRCFWCRGHADYIEYHDEEWGRPVTDNNRLFEKLCLEGFQSGLSWLTILRKRPSFRAAFCDFSIRRVAQFGERDVERLMGDASIVRHRGKIEAAIGNATCALAIEKELGSLSTYLWQFAPPEEERPARRDFASLRPLTETAASRRLSRDLKSRGFRFVGPTTAYAFMQAMGMVNDHIDGCSIRDEVTRLQRRARRGAP